MPTACFEKVWAGVTKDWESFNCIAQKSNTYTGEQVNKYQVIVSLLALTGASLTGSLVTSKDGMIHHFVTNCLDKQSNSLRTVFLNTQLQGGFHHVQSLNSLKNSENLEKSLCVRGRAENQCLILVTSDPSGGTGLKIEQKAYISSIQKRGRLLWAHAHLR